MAATSASPFADLLDFLPDVLAWVKDRHGRYVWVNRAFVIQYALDHQSADEAVTAASILGKTDYDLSPAFLADVYFQFGHKPDLFENRAFTTLFLNAIRWASERQPVVQ
jgi:hypothetical protein